MHGARRKRHVVTEMLQTTRRAQRLRSNVDVSVISAGRRRSDWLPSPRKLKKRPVCSCL